MAKTIMSEVKRHMTEKISTTYITDKRPLYKKNF